MKIEEYVPLSRLTTLRIGGPARFLIQVGNESEVREAIRFAKEQGLPFYPLGQGSNVLALDEGYTGVILKMELPRVAFLEEEDDAIVVAEAGVSWDALVQEAARRGLWGIENLAGIPGTVGAAPVQNIGAYGVELKDSVEWVEALEIDGGNLRRFSKDACAFAYRDSYFKREPGHLIVRVALRLTRQGIPHTEYPDLVRAKDASISLTTPEEIGEAVRAIRAKKFPDLTIYGTAGSFFKNPFISEDAYQALQKHYPALPGFPTPAGVKISLAWILDHVLALRGFSKGLVSLYEAQPLVMVAKGGATAHDVSGLAHDVVEKVQQATGIIPEWEVRTIK
ncbi:MAG: UDP-N-acetylmuramate dehydrogenase [Minisyncoccia bacterium]